MTDNDDTQAQTEKLRQFFSVAQEFNNDFFDLMIKQIETFDCSDEERSFSQHLSRGPTSPPRPIFCWKWKITLIWSVRSPQAE